MRRLSAIEFVIREDNNEDQRGQESKSFSGHYAYGRFSVFNVYLICYPLWSLVCLWTFYYSVAEGEIVGWVKKTHSEPLVKESSVRVSRAIRCPRNLLGLVPS